jgi:hypothetical protein
MASKAIGELAALAKTLNSESNSINEIIVDFNAQLSALNLGIEAWFDSETAEGAEVGFGKVFVGSPGKYSWELAFRRGSGAEPLLAAPRDLRIDGISKMDEIVYRLRSEVEHKIDVIRQAKQRLHGTSAEFAGAEITDDDIPF